MHLVSYYMTNEHVESICVDEFSILLYDEMSIFAASLDLNGVALFWMDTTTKKNF